MNTGTVIIVVTIVGAILFLIWREDNINSKRKITQPIRPSQPMMQPSCAPCKAQEQKIVIDQNQDPYSDSIKRQDMYHMYDPLTYPQLRLPRDVLQKYGEYYKQHGVYPPFNYATQPELFDNPIMVGYLQKDLAVVTNDIDSPVTVPLFRVKSSKNANRFFYYIMDQRFPTKIDVKIPLNNVLVNGTRYTNSDYYGLPELFDDDTVEQIAIYPTTKYIVRLYKSYFFP